MTKLTIQSGAEIPPAKHNVRGPKYPFNEMQVGDYLSLEGRQEFDRVRRAAMSYGKRHGKRFESRTGYDGENKVKDHGGSVWRTA